MELVREVSLGSLKDRAFVLGVFTVFFLIAPGIAGIYHYHPDFIVELDAVKLILLSITCTMPFAVLNAMTFGITQNRKREKNDDLFYDFVLGTIFSGVMIYFGVIFAFALNWPIEVLGLFLLFLEACVLLGIWLGNRRKS